VIIHIPLSSVTENNPMNLECFVEDLFLGGQWSIILGYRRLSVKSLLVHILGILSFIIEEKRNEMYARQIPKT